MKRLLTTMTMAALVVSGFATTSASKVEAATTYKVKVMADGLRVRTGPSTAYKIVGSVNTGQTFNYLGVSGSWTKISYGGASRYVSSTYVKNTAQRLQQKQRLASRVQQAVQSRKDMVLQVEFTVIRSITVSISALQQVHLSMHQPLVKSSHPVITAHTEITS